MLKAFFHDGAVYGLVRVVTSSVYLLLVPLYTRSLSTADYGVVDFLMIFSNLIYLVVTFEIAQGFARYFAESKSAEEKISYASSTLWFTIVAYTLFTISALFFSQILSNVLLDSSEYKDIVKVAALAMWGHGLFYLVQNQLRYELKAGKYAIASLAFGLVSVVMTIVLLLVFELGVMGVFLAQLSANLAGAVVGLYFARHSYRWVFDWGKCQEMMRFSIPLCFSSLGVFAALYMDRIAIRYLMSIDDLGIYAVGYRIASVTLLAMAGFQMALTPLIYQHYRKEETPQEIERIFRWFLSLVFPLVLLVGMFSVEVISIFGTEQYTQAHRVVFVLAMAFLFSNMYMFGPGLWIAKKTRVIAAINLVAAGLNLLLNFAFIPYLGILGAALATCVSALVALVGYIVLGQNLYRIPYQWGRIGPSLIIMIALAAPSMQTNNIWSAASGLWGLLFKGLVLIATSVVLTIFLVGLKEVTASVEFLRNRLKTFIPVLVAKTPS